MKYLGLVLLFIVSLFAVDCAPQTVAYHYTEAPKSLTPMKVVPIWVDITFSDNDKEAIREAVTQWNLALNGHIVLKIASEQFDMEPDVINGVMVKGNGWLVLKINSMNSIVHDDGSNLTLAFVNTIGSDGNRIYFVRDRMFDSWVQGIMMHEMGHLLGSDHNHSDLMAPHFNWAGYRCVDKKTLSNVASYWHIPMDHLRYCVYDQ